MNSSSYKDWAWLVAINCIIQNRLLKCTKSREDSVNEHFIAAVTGVCVSLLQRKEKTMHEATPCDFALIITALNLNYIIHKIKGVNQKTSEIPLKILSEVYV